MYTGRIYNVSRWRLKRSRVLRYWQGGGRGGAGACWVSTPTGMLRIRASGPEVGERLDGEGARVSTSGGTESRVNISTGLVSESAPRVEPGVESTSRRGWCPSQRLGWERKSSQRLDWTGVRVSTSDGNGSQVNTLTGRLRISSQHLEMSGEWSCSRVSFSSAWERRMVSIVETGPLIYPGAAYGPSGVGVWDAVVCVLRYARAIGG